MSSRDTRVKFLSATQTEKRGKRGDMRRSWILQDSHDNEHNVFGSRDEQA